MKHWQFALAFCHLSLVVAVAFAYWIYSAVLKEFWKIILGWLFYKLVLFGRQLVHYIPLTSGSFPCQFSSGLTVPPSGDPWHMWWPCPQVQLHFAQEALFGRNPKLWSPMDNKVFFDWHNLVFSIFRDILLGLVLPIVKLFITIHNYSTSWGRCCMAV